MRLKSRYTVCFNSDTIYSYDILITLCKIDMMKNPMKVTFQKIDIENIKGGVIN